MRVMRGLPSLRAQALVVAGRRAIGKASREWFRLIHFSLQSNHIHLIVEASDKSALSRGMAGLAIRLARALNSELGRTGRLFSDRYHARDLVTPREVRHAIVYVLMNHKKHLTGAVRVDSASSAFWFDGWNVRPKIREPPGWVAGEAAPIMHPRTWLARLGWHRHGLIRANERPRR
jgi:REP element-mobilizing transposase RayT